MSSTVVAYVPDLMDRSKVAAAVPDRVTFTSSPADLVAQGGGAELVVVDLGRPGVVEAVAALAASDGRPRILGFASHVDRDTMDAARDAGCDRVLARSAFFADLPALLA